MPSAHEIFRDRMAENFEGLWRDRRLPASELIGLQVLEADQSKGHIRTRFDASGNLLNAMGYVQGGMLTAMLDDTLSLAGTVASGFERLMLTHELKTCYLKPVSAGHLFGEGRVVQMGKSLAFLEGELRDEENALIATATATARPFCM